MHKHLHECLDWPGPVTHPQYLAWQAYLRMEWNHPSRSDNYLMRIIQVLRNSDNVTLTDCKIPFMFPTRAYTLVNDKRKKDIVSRAAVRAFTGIKNLGRRKPPNG